MAIVPNHNPTTVNVIIIHRLFIFKFSIQMTKRKRLNGNLYLN